MNRKKEIERKKERNANKGEKSKGTIEYHPSIPAVRELNSRRKRIRNARWRCQKERVRVRSVERQKRPSSSPIVNRYIHSAEFTHKAIPMSKDENAPPSPSPNPNRDTSLCYNVV